VRQARNALRKRSGVRNGRRIGMREDEHGMARYSWFAAAGDTDTSRHQVTMTCAGCIARASQRIGVEYSLSVAGGGCISLIPGVFIAKEGACRRG
jgi:hypothetical protein